MSENNLFAPMVDYLTRDDARFNIIEGATHCPDKIGHGYIPSYERIAAELGPSANVCELGVAGGASLKMWREQFFPGGIVAGVDVCGVWPPNTVKITSEQTASDLPGRMAKISPSWNLIIDDCSHDGNLTLESWKLLWPLVAPGGYYVIEDWINADDPNGYYEIDEDFKASVSDIDRPDEPMLKMALSLVERIRRDAEIESIEYRRCTNDGLIILQKRK